MSHNGQPLVVPSEVFVRVLWVSQSSASVLLELGQPDGRSLINTIRFIFYISYNFARGNVFWGPRHYSPSTAFFVPFCAWDLCSLPILIWNPYDNPDDNKGRFSSHISEIILRIDASSEAWTPSAPAGCPKSLAEERLLPVSPSYSRKSVRAWAYLRYPLDGFSDKEFERLSLNLAADRYVSGYVSKPSGFPLILIDRCYSIIMKRRSAGVCIRLPRKILRYLE